MFSDSSPEPGSVNGFLAKFKLAKSGAHVNPVVGKGCFCNTNVALIYFIEKKRYGLTLSIEQTQEREQRHESIHG